MLVVAGRVHGDRLVVGRIFGGRIAPGAAVSHVSREIRSSGARAIAEEEEESRGRGIALELR